MTQHQEYLKLPLLNAHKSAAIGWWLVALPSLFLACVVMKYIFKADLHFIDTLFNTLSVFDRAHGWWFSPLLFLFFPLVAAGMNLLSLLKIMYDKERNEYKITIKVRFWNLFLIALGFGIALIVGFYVVTENTIKKIPYNAESSPIEKTN